MINKIIVRRNPRFKNSDFREFTFKPGLNIIVGPNTSGKSSLLSIIRQFNGYTENFWSNTTQNFENYNAYTSQLKSSNTIVDGKISKLVEYKPQELREENNLNFMQSSIFTAVQSKFQSNGEGRYSYHEEFFQRLMNDNKLDENQIKILVDKKLEFDNNLILVADEPDNSMSLIMQFGLFEYFKNLCKINSRLQVIIATHSLAAYCMKDVNIIEMNKNWIAKTIKKCKMALQ